MDSHANGIYRTLRENLLAGVYPVGSPLIPGVLSEDFKVSRTPVREALALLAQDGLIEPVRRGFMITQRGDDELLELFEAQAALDAAVASAAADRRTDVDLLRLQDALDRSMQHDDPVDVRLALRQWHAALREAAHNRTMTDLLDRLDAQIKLGAPWKPSHSDGAFERPIAEHREILAAVRERDRDAARLAMLAHHAADRDNRIAQLAQRHP
jgi:DNA-binding GntR family transcriptional regulator